MPDDSFAGKIIDRNMRMLSHTILSAKLSTHTFFCSFYALNFEKVEGAYCFGLVRVCVCVCAFVKKKKKIS